jgi:hypothetical protein
MKNSFAAGMNPDPYSGTMIRFVSSVLIAGALIGCGSDPEPTPATFQNVQTKVLNLSCNNFQGCHRGASPAGQLSLESPAYDKLFKMAVADPSKTIVVAGKPEDSYIIDKMRNRNVNGAFMPPTGMIEEDRIELVERWIAAGAKND